ncbi:MAG: hypothetical protein ACREO3_08010 [Arenimonas sp.]
MDTDPRRDGGDPPVAALPWAQRFGVVAWPSFFAAGVATMVFFAFVDPLQLRDITFPGLGISRETGYSIAFFLFWSATAGASLFTAILMRPTLPRGRRGD